MRKLAHIVLAETTNAHAQRSRVLAAIKDKQPILIQDMDAQGGVLTYAYEGEEMQTPHVGDRSLYYQIELDLTANALYVHMDNKQDRTIESVASLDGDGVVDFFWGSDGLPIVVGFELLNANKLGIIQDWIDEGIQNALSQLNTHPKHDYADNHWKGVLVGGEE